MGRQARRYAAGGEQGYVQNLFSNRRRESSYDIVRRRADEDVKLNVTAIMTIDQVRNVVEAVKEGAPSCISVFAGRIADTGRDPVPMMSECVSILKAAPQAELIWASPRELLNIIQADDIGCHI